MSKSSAALSLLLRDRAGSMSLMIAVIIILLAGLFSLAIDAGSLYASKRRLQGAVDLAALKAVTDLTNAAMVAESVVVDNFTGVAMEGSVAAERGDYPPPGYTFATLGDLPAESRFLPNPTGNAVRISADHNNQLYLARLFHPGPVTLRARSVAVNRPLAQLAIRSGLVSVDSSRSEMLDSVLSGFLGTSVRLSAVSYQGLASTEVSTLDFLDAAGGTVGADAGDYDAILDASISIDEIADAAASVAAGDADPSAGLADALTALDAIASQLSAVPDIRLGDIIEIDAERPEQAVGTRLNLLSLVVAAAEAANSAHDLGAEVDLPAAGGTATIRAAVIEPTRFSALGGEGISVRTAQTRLLLDFALPNAADVLGSLLSIRLPVYIELASGTATITRIACNGPSTAGARVSVDANSSAATVLVADVDPGSLGFSLPPSRQAAALVDSPLARVTGTAELEAGSGEEALTFTSPFTQDRFQTVATQSPLEGLAADLFEDIDLNVEVLGIPLAAGALVESAVRDALQASAPVVDAAVDTLLEVIGAEAGYSEVAVNYLRCSNPLVVQ